MDGMSLTQEEVANPSSTSRRFCSGWTPSAANQWVIHETGFGTLSSPTKRGRKQSPRSTVSLWLSQKSATSECGRLVRGVAVEWFDAEHVECLFKVVGCYRSLLSATHTKPDSIIFFVSRTMVPGLVGMLSTPTFITSDESRT